MKHLINIISTWITVIGWIMGIALASGGWSTAFAICIPPYAWYLLLERLMKLAGVI